MIYNFIENPEKINDVEKMGDIKMNRFQLYQRLYKGSGMGEESD